MRSPHGFLFYEGRMKTKFHTVQNRELRGYDLIPVRSVFIRLIRGLCDQ
jgi:hypothetical protein